MKKILQFIILITISFFMNSCYYDSIYEPTDDGGNGGGDPVLVSYQNDVAPLWSQCVACHNGNEPPDLQNNSYDNLLNGFVVPNDADASVLYKSLLGDGAPLMPPGGQWPDTKINLVRDWINQGALDN